MFQECECFQVVLCDFLQRRIVNLNCSDIWKECCNACRKLAADLVDKLYYTDIDVSRSLKMIFSHSAYRCELRSDVQVLHSTHINTDFVRIDVFETLRHANHIITFQYYCNGHVNNCRVYQAFLHFEFCWDASLIVFRHSVRADDSSSSLMRLSNVICKLEIVSVREYEITCNSPRS